MSKEQSKTMRKLLNYTKISANFPYVFPKYLQSPLLFVNSQEWGKNKKIQIKNVLERWEVKDHKTKYVFFSSISSFSAQSSLSLSVPSKTDFIEGPFKKVSNNNGIMKTSEWCCTKLIYSWFSRRSTARGYCTCLVIVGPTKV